MTEKQRNYINWICDMLDVEYTGITKKDAWEFINKYKDEAHNIANTYRFDETDYMLFPDEGYYC